ncbi:DUF1513 domain-containing protein [Pseudovibrio sp. SPO723]|uniref:DUF1513 domain-containing protein n=1 Tax=Nesiotobacter zosterae TaxID=392721 RepID=UPI0029C42014|nr:DUF1513 domain-containing protein [Pseudovibrio sp. SPO723]MDX5593276.1 DUF1513 domain-containing protein [Pseudovibrio sp. SPO723]
MRSMVTRALPLSRRSLLQGLAGLAVTTLVPGGVALANAKNTRLFQTNAEEPLFASAFRKADGSFAFRVMREDGSSVFEAPLPDRGHSAAWHRETAKLVAFARRPGNFAMYVNGMAGDGPVMFTAPEDRHFYGHGVFSQDGKVLYAPENDWVHKRGVLGLYDMTGARPHRIGEMDTGGIGPHDILLSPTCGSLVIANGGIHTRPDRDREKLNIDSMLPSVAFLHPQTGEIRARHELDPSLHQLSLRHMAMDGHGRVWVGGQYQGDKSELPPLIASFTLDGTPRIHEMPQQIKAQLSNYVGSVTASGDGEVIVTSCPRGGKILFWNASSGDYIGAQAVADGCGVAPLDQEFFLISDGSGGLRFAEGTSEYLELTAQVPGTSWDNHLISL